ncbi:hypothetical protein F7725_021143 [Dissostichus mawsoni]|uniref:long-chain-fatty-acid--CoA ligase n=1 Tax=Dissostichus mawsoni TaxID=36200 RepID=A0A7J5YFB0_DISMA|nr:hypothetical protein F7725_021143 [Dissostichus mawsoni]
MKLKEDLSPVLLLVFHLAVWIYSFLSFLPSVLLSWMSTLDDDDGVRYGSEEDRAKRMKACSEPGCPEGPYRAVRATKRLEATLRPGVQTLDKMFEFAARRFPHRHCLGTREDVFSAASQLGSGLASLGQRQKNNIAIFCETRAEWIVAAQACFMHNFPVVTLYSTLGGPAIAHGLNETQVTHIFTSKELLETRLKAILIEVPRLQHIIVVDDSPSSWPGYPPALASTTWLPFRSGGPAGERFSGS